MVRKWIGAALLCLALPLSAQIRQGGMVKADGSEALTGTVTTTGTLASGQVALGSGATSITGDAGCTWTGTGASFVATFGGGVSTKKLELTAGAAIPTLGLYTDGSFVIFGSTGVFRPFAVYATYAAFGADVKLAWTNAANNPITTTDLALSRASAGTLLVEDGSGNARDVQARTVLAGDGSAAAPSYSFAAHTGTGMHVGVSNELAFDTSGARRAYFDSGATGFHLDVPLEFGGYGTYLSSAATPRVSVGSTTTLGNEGGDIGARTGYFGTSVVTPVVSGGADSATPNATAINGTNSRGGTDTNVAGGNLTIRPGAGTGSATGSSIVFQTPTAGASGTTGQTQTTRLTISETEARGPVKIISAYPGALAFAAINGGSYTWFGNNGSGDFEIAESGGTPIFTLKQAGNVITTAPLRLKGYTVATLPSGTVGDTAYVTDATAPTYNAALTGGGAVTIPVFYNGAAWVSH